MLTRTFEKKVLLLIIKEIIEPELQIFGFKFFKSKMIFKKRHGEFLHNIFVGTGIPKILLRHNEKTKFTYANILLSYSVKAPVYDKWLSQKINKKCEFHHKVYSLEFSLPIELLDIMDIDNDNFVTFSNPNRKELKFKEAWERKVLKHIFKDHRSCIIPQSLQSHFEEFLPSKVKKLEEMSDYHKLFEARERPFTFNYVSLLAFVGDPQGAELIYDEYHRRITEKINETGKSSLVRLHNEYINKVFLTTGKKYKPIEQI